MFLKLCLQFILKIPSFASLGHPAHHKLIKRKQLGLLTNRPHPLSPINMALKVLVNTCVWSMHIKFGEILSNGL